MADRLARAIVRQAGRLLDVTGNLAMRGTRDHNEAAARAMADAWRTVGGALREQVHACYLEMEQQAAGGQAPAAPPGHPAAGRPAPQDRATPQRSQF